MIIGVVVLSILASGSAPRSVAGYEFVAKRLCGPATETSTIRVDDLWTIPDLTLPGTSVWNRLSEAYAAASGLIVRRETASRLSGPSGAEQSTRTVCEVSRLRPAAIPAGLFDAPAAAPAVTRLEH